MERKLKLGLALFQQHGGIVVFFGRFVTVLRVWAALLAGIFHVRWSRFLLYNALGSLMWATSYGLGGYYLGDNVHRLTGSLGWGLLGGTGCLMVVCILLWRKREKMWEERALRLFPGPLALYLGKGAGKQVGQEPPALPQWQQDWENIVTQPLQVPAKSKPEQCQKI
jgi:hypothetical protein